MELSLKEYDFEEAKTKDEILRFCQSSNRKIINSVSLFTGILKGKKSQDEIRYLLKSINKDGYLKEHRDARGQYKYDIRADRFIIAGGYTQLLLDERKIESGEDIGDIFSSLISEAIDNNIKEDFYSISEGLNRIVKEFENSEDSNWYNIGNDCRILLEDFVKELINKGEIKVEGKEKEGDVKTLIGKLVSDKIDSKNIKGRLSNLVKSIWDYVQPVTHRKTTTKEEALRAFIWTTLFVNEIIILLKKPLTKPK